MIHLFQRAGGLVVALALCVSAHAAPTPPDATLPIGPGDILISEFFNGWHKINPVTGEVTNLPWPVSSLATYVDFDADGAILFGNSDSTFHRLNPWTGFTTPLNIPDLSSVSGFVVEPNGDLILANSGAVSRFSREHQTTTTVTDDTFFSPRGIAQGADGRVFITEFFNDLWEISPTTGSRNLVTPVDLTAPSLIAVRSDGDLIVQNFSPQVLYRVNPDTGDVSLFTDDLPTFVRGITLDANDDLWLSSTDGVFRYSSNGGAGTLVASGTFFSPRAITVVPLSWTPIPEPTTGVLALAFTVCGIGRRCTWKRMRPYGVQETR